MMQNTEINTVMRAIADPTRRAVLERIARTPESTVVDLTQGSGVTQGAISQHLKLLKAAGLVADRPEGRRVFYRAVPGGLRPLVDWLEVYGRFWTDRLDDLERLLREEDDTAAEISKGEEQ